MGEQLVLQAWYYKTIFKFALKFRTKELKCTKKAFSREKGQFPDFSLIFPWLLPDQNNALIFPDFPDPQQPCIRIAWKAVDRGLVLW